LTARLSSFALASVGTKDASEELQSRPQTIHSQVLSSASASRWYLMIYPRKGDSRHPAFCSNTAFEAESLLQSQGTDGLMACSARTRPITEFFRKTKFIFSCPSRRCYPWPSNGTELKASSKSSPPSRSSIPIPRWNWLPIPPSPISTTQPSNSRCPSERTTL